MRTDRQPAVVPAELVEDLNLQRWSRPTSAWGDWYTVDRRRLRRELRHLSALHAAAARRFAADLENIAEQRRTYGKEYYYTADGRLVSPEDLVRIRELVDAAVVRSPAASR